MALVRACTLFAFELENEHELLLSRTTKQSLTPVEVVSSSFSFTFVLGIIDILQYVVKLKCVLLDLIKRLPFMPSGSSIQYSQTNRKLFAEYVDCSRIIRNLFLVSVNYSQIIPKLFVEKQNHVKISQTIRRVFVHCS